MREREIEGMAITLYVDSVNQREIHIEVNREREREIDVDMW